MLYLIVFLGAGLGGALRHGVNVGATKLFGFGFPFGTSFAPDPIFSRFPAVLLLAHAAHAVGIAEGAIMDLVELAGTGVKQQFMVTKLVETERFKEGLARLDAELMAARALLEAQTASVWQSSVRAPAKDLAGVAEQLQAAAWITSATSRPETEP